MPPADYSTGSACCPWSFSAPGDQRAEIPPVPSPRTLVVSARRMMRLTRILIFPFFLSASWISSALHRRAFHNAQKNSPGNVNTVHAVNRPVNLALRSASIWGYFNSRHGPLSQPRRVDTDRLQYPSGVKAGLELGWALGALTVEWAKQNGSDKTAG
jgi:hypothetical protein